MNFRFSRLHLSVGLVISLFGTLAFAEGRVSESKGVAFIPSELTDVLKPVAVKELMPECLPVSVWTRVSTFQTIDRHGKSVFGVSCRDANNKASIHYVDPKTGDEISAETVTRDKPPPPPAEVSAGLKIPNNWFIGSTDDKRFSVYAVTPAGIDSMAVVDTQTNKMIWRRKYEGKYPTPYNDYFGSIRQTKQGLAAFIDRGQDCPDDGGLCGKHSLIRIQIPSGVESSVKLDDDVFSHMSPYGVDEVIYLIGPTGPDTLRDDARATIVKLNDMKVKWTGKRSEAPPPSKGIYCATPVNKEEFKLPFDPMAMNAISWNRDILISAKDQSGRLTSVTPGASCAVSADGRSVIIAIPPKIAVYTLR